MNRPSLHSHTFQVKICAPRVDSIRAAWGLPGHALITICHLYQCEALLTPRACPNTLSESKAEVVSEKSQMLGKKLRQEQGRAASGKAKEANARCGMQEAEIHR